MYVKSMITVSTPQDRAIKARQKAAAASRRGFFVDGVFIETIKPKPVTDRLSSLKKRLRKLKENYKIFVKIGDTESALQFEAEIKKVVEQIAKEKAA